MLSEFHSGIVAGIGTNQLLLSRGKNLSLVLLVLQQRC